MIYHYVFSTYMRKQILEDQEAVNLLKNAFFEIAKEKQFKILACEILTDHVHILIEQDYSVSASCVMKFLKGISSKKFFSTFKVNRLEFKKLWGRSFYAKKIKPSEVQNIVNYINNQRILGRIDKRYVRGAENLFSGDPDLEPRIYSQAPFGAKSLCS